jgi:hypothetical protein
MTHATPVINRILNPQKSTLEAVDTLVNTAIKRGQSRERLLQSCGDHIDVLITDRLEDSVFCNTADEQSFKDRTIHFVTTYWNNRLLEVPSDGTWAHDSIADAGWLDNVA